MQVVHDCLGLPLMLRLKRRPLPRPARAAQAEQPGCQHRDRCEQQDGQVPHAAQLPAGPDDSKRRRDEEQEEADKLAHAPHHAGPAAAAEHGGGEEDRPSEQKEEREDQGEVKELL